MFDPASVGEYYVHLFPARTDVYSIWVPKLQGWRPVREPLTAEVANDGLTRKGPAISGFMIAPDSVSHSMAVDFDTENGLEQAFELARAMAAAGLPAYVETSRRGAHLWCVLDRVLPARTIRRGLRAFFASALIPTEDHHIEIRPGSDTVDARWHEHVSGAVVGTGLGHALRLPLMPHPKTGKRPSFMDGDGRTMGPSVAAILLDIEWGDAAIIETWATRWKPATKPGDLGKRYREPQGRREDPYEDASVVSILHEYWGIEATPGGREVRCPAHEDRNPSLYVFPDDRRVLCHSSVCVLNNSDRGRGTYELTRLAPRHG